LSDKLKKHYPGKPKPKEQRRYFLTQRQIRKRQSDGSLYMDCPNSRTLPDKYTIRDGEARRTIAFIAGSMPDMGDYMQTGDPKQQLANVIGSLGTIEFLRTNMGEIVVSADNYNLMAETDMFLWFCPWLVQNANAEFHIQDRKLGYFIDVDSPARTAEANLGILNDIWEAETIVRKMSNASRSAMVRALELGWSKDLSDEEILNSLLIFVQKKDGKAKNARRLKVQSKEGNIVIRELLAVSIKRNLVKASDDMLSLLWKHSEQVICHKMNNMTLEDSFVIFSSTDTGAQTVDMLNRLIAGEENREAKADKGDITAGDTDNKNPFPNEIKDNPFKLKQDVPVKEPTT
jgi:hypothetical protein